MSDRSKLLIVGLVFSGLLTTGYIVFTANRSIAVAVQGRDWRREIQVENYLSRAYSGWDEQMPGDAYNRSCSRRQRGSHQQYMGQTCNKVGAQNVCTSNYITIADYDDYCSWTADRWGYVRSLVADGDVRPIWPSVDVTPCESNSIALGCEREGQHVQTYTVHFQDTADGRIYACSYEQDYWASFNTGELFRMDVGQFTNWPRCETVSP